MTTINQVLTIDKKYRIVGVTDDLHTIDQLVSDLTLDYDMPTLCGKNNDKPNVLLNSKLEFIKKINEKYPFLKNINMKNLLVAGGSISNIIRNKNNDTSDVDFFVYGLDQNTATVRVKEWLLDIILPKKMEDDHELLSGQKKEKEYKIGHYKIMKNNNSIAILLENCDMKIQLIFRLYKSISEILHGFDLGSSAVGYDGSNVYFTTLGKFCHEHSCNIVDTTRRSTTYEYRLTKYFKRGFNIVLPNLDIPKLRTNYFKYDEIEICELPYFIFGYSNVVGNKIIVKDFYNKFGNNSDYDLEPMDPMNIYYRSLKINIINLINDIEYFYYVSSYIDENNVDILNKPPRLNKGSIITFYDEIRDKLSKKNIDVNLIKKYISVEKIENIVVNMFNEKIDTNTYFDELIEKQKNLALLKLDKLLTRDHSIINWMIENPGTQLTSSFNPIIEDESKWYGGVYYKKK